ncbi:DUF4174 domain-containing protein [Robertkochia flava]|uniref:DUF4174 domain-containing protein n=1 Tax=Robertkochia flava TaxID=3447986 RepID=UPI001CCDE369|nr:DUF4174 domain-containing protein [Robertkochia marina]
MSISLVLILLSTTLTQEFTPEQFRWKNRLLIIVTPNHEPPGISEHYQLFSKAPEANTDRDLLIITLSGDKVWIGNTATTASAGVWRTHFSISPRYSGVILVGKDGSVKLKEEKITSPGVVYDRIDSMPMRKQEMSKKN